MRYLLLLLALPALAVTNIPVVVTGVTNQQAVLQYTAPDSGVCTVTAVPINTALLPEVYDLDGTLFPGANMDNKAGDFASGLVRTIIIGHRTSAIATDGTTYSLSLASASQYTFGISCDSGSYTGSGQFTTDTLRVGNTAPDQADYDTSNTDFGSWLYPTIHYDSLTPTYIDPHTGSVLKRVSGPGEAGAGVNTQCLPNVVDLASAWTTPQNLADCTGDTNYASYAGSAGASAALFLWNPSPGRAGLSGIAGPSFLPNSWETADDWQISLKGHSSSGTASVNTCLTYDYGATCVGATLTTVMGTSDTTVAMPTSSTYPSPYFHDWSDAPVRNDMLTNSFGGTLASVSGHTVTWGSNVDPRGSGYSVYFPVTVLKPGMKILISGQTSVCPVACTIATVINETQLTTVESLVSGTGNSYSFPNWGFKVWKSGTGTLFLDSANSSYANSAGFFTGYEGGSPPFCSIATVTVSYAADGTTPITPVQAYTCVLLSQFDTQNYFIFIPSTGEARWISTLSSLSVELNVSVPTQLFAYNITTHHIEQCNYDPTTAHWATYPLYNQSLNPAITCQPVTVAPNDVASEIAASSYPTNPTSTWAVDQTYFGAPNLITDAQTVNCPGGITVSPCLFNFQLQPQQGALTWYCDIDVALTPGPAQVVNCHNSWDTYPIRWVGQHGNEQFDIPSAYTSMGVGAPLASMGVKAIEQWNFNINTIYNNGGAKSLSNTFVDPSGSCQQIVTASGGGTLPAWLANQIPTVGGGVAGASLDCIRMNVPNEPAATSPASADLVALGSLPVGSRPTACSFNSAWSCLQTAQPGDYLGDTAESVGGEKFLLLYKATLGGSSGYDLVLARGLNPWYCRTYPQLYLYTTHTSTWIPYEFPPNSCGATNFVIPNSSPTSLAVLDNPSLGTGHVGGKGTSTGYNYQWVPYDQNPPVDLGAYGSNYGVRGGIFPAIVGAGVQYGVGMSQGFASPGHALDFTQIFYSTLQSHPAGGNYAAPVREQVWGVDGRAMGGAGGGLAYLWTQVGTPVSGFSTVYQLTGPTSGVGQPVLNNGGNWYANLKRKLHGQAPFSGFHLLQDISSSGSSITDAKPWSYCVADVTPGECASGSVKGNLYVAIPEASTSGNCNLDGTANWLCVASAPPLTAAFTQYDVTIPDYYGLHTRVVTTLLNGPGRTDNYANIHTLVTGDWLMGVVKWGDGKRSDMFAVLSPPWPNYDSVNRNQYVQVPIQMTGGTGVTVRARFGYAPNLFCSTRQEQCTTAVPTGNADPFVWASETQQWANCLTTCTIRIPAIAGRVLYYTIDTKVGSGTASMSMPPIAVN